VQDTNLTVIGAGPYGLSAAAFLRVAGIETRVFGDPMAFWKNRMPAGMFLRSNWKASHIADPDKKTTLDAYSRWDWQPRASTDTAGAVRSIWPLVSGKDGSRG
jgi:cation diffusion facilitator CzcD-associated flavoprotein CzcO